jgi:hypothetical protein
VIGRRQLNEAEFDFQENATLVQTQSITSGITTADASSDSTYTASINWNPSQAQQLVQEISAIGGCQKTPASGKRWRVVMCTTVRNDPHFREFLVRNLLAGFSHIVVLDNNRIATGKDLNLTLVAQPFVAAGLVTQIPFLQDASSKYLHNDVKQRRLHECFSEFGIQSDWVVSMDTDEAIFVSRHSQPANNSSNSTTDSLGMVGALFEDLEATGQNLCSLVFPWRMMYGEHKVIKNNSALLMDTFPRICYTSIFGKTFFRYETANPDPPHHASCKADSGLTTTSVDRPDFKARFPQYTAHNVHYYAKTVQEYIIKSEQSMPPVSRLLTHSYFETNNAATHIKCSMEPVQYDAAYSSTVRRIVDGLRLAQAGLGDGGVQLSWPPGEASCTATIQIRVVPHCCSRHRCLCLCVCKCIGACRVRRRKTAENLINSLSVERQCGGDCVVMKQR